MSLRRNAAYLRSRRSSALILTLLLVTLLTVLLVGFMTNMGFELNSSVSHLNKVQSDLYAQMGSDVAVAELRSSLASGTNAWLSRPGELFLWPTNNTTATPTVVDLSSGGAAPNASTDVAADLNPKTFYTQASGNPGYLIDSASAQPMRIKWVYIYEDGTYTTAAPSAFTQPVIGRFAYWIDDESSRINLNTAWTRGAENTNTISDPSLVELSGLFTNVDAIATARAANAYNSLLDASRASSEVPGVLAQQGFSFTHYNHSPNNLNMLGKPRILLTTQKSVADANGTTNFLDILATPNTDPGLRANLDGTKVAAAVNTVYSYLTNTTWPILPNASFANKYAPSNNYHAMQLAIDIVEYVRSEESSATLVDPLRGDISASGFNMIYTAFDANAILGHVRGPRLTQASFTWNSPVAPSTTPTITARIAISLPPHSGISSMNLTNLYLGFQCWAGKDHPSTTGANWSFQPDWRIAPSECSPSSTLTNGGTCFVTRTSTILPAIENGTTVPFTLPTDGSDMVSARFYISDPAPAAPAAPNSDATLYDVVPATISSTKALNCRLDGTTYRTDDTEVNKRIVDWTNAASFVSALGQTSTASPQQDTDASGAITNVSVVFPVPKGAPSIASDPISVANPAGLVQSVGVLGYVHTGVEANLTTPGFGVPYRTLRLQPEKAGSTDLPDWALLDAFAAPLPATATNAFTTPTVTSIGGRVNVNSEIVPFTNAAGSPTEVRTAPLQALFQNISYANGATTTQLSSAQAGLAATNVASHTLASAHGNAGRLYGTGPLTNTYYSPGQVAEIAGVSDSGEPSEGVIRAMYGNAAVSGNVFSIYSVGESIRQDKTGAIHVLGERRIHHIVERIDTGTAVSFQPVFTEAMNP